MVSRIPPRWSGVRKLLRHSLFLRLKSISPRGDSASESPNNAKNLVWLADLGSDDKGIANIPSILRYQTIKYAELSRKRQADVALFLDRQPARARRCPSFDYQPQDPRNPPSPTSLRQDRSVLDASRFATISECRSILAESVSG